MRFRVGRWVRGFTGLIRYGGLIGVHRSARLSVQGAFTFGERVSIGRNSIVQVPKNSRLRLGHGVYIGREVEMTPTSEISIGSFTTVQDRCIFLGDVDIGANCVFAPNVFISSATHQFMERPAWLIRDQDALVADPGYKGASARNLPIEVHDDCWLGINSVVMRGVTLGRGCVVGANSVVTKSAAPYSVIAGTPARLISRRLEFRPPASISSENPADLPYFYSGFDLRQQTIATSPQGHKAHGRFRLALDCRGASAICLEFEADRPLTLACLEQKQQFAPGSHRVSFRLAASPTDGLVVSEARDVERRPCRVSIRRASAEI
jgi:acetyltransferase-like isoleucine patch superfamily enzyme